MADAIPLSSVHIARLAAALEEAFTLDELRQIVRAGLEGGLTVSLDSVVPVPGRTLHDICHDLVLWALRDKRVGLQGLLAAAVQCNPRNPQLLTLQTEWAGKTFTRPVCPYPGMKAFTAADQARFYGRDSEIVQAVDKLCQYPLLAIVGSSGSGKSSLLAAGILPALASSHYFADCRWVVHSMRPGAAPFTTLLALFGMAADEQSTQLPELPLVEPGTQRLLVIDQYEELYTTASAHQRECFEQSLLQLIEARTIYLLPAMRADFYTNLMDSPVWASVRNHRLEITPPRGDALRDAITLPARDVGVTLDAALVQRLLADAGDEPGVLPFIQETLVMLWSHAQRLEIGLSAYTSLIGDNGGRSGLQVALAGHAEHVYNDELADDGERSQATRILLRLVQFGKGRADTRRQQTLDELRQGVNGSFEKVLAVLTANRLLTLSDEAQWVDLSHEALIQGWPRLQRLTEQRRAAELTRRRLEEQAQERLRLGQNNEVGGLLDPVELAEAEAWVQSEDAAELGVSEELATLVADSRLAIDRAAREKQQAAERLRRRNQWLAIALAAALVAVAIAVLFFFNAQNEARNARSAEATAQANAAEAADQRNLAQANAAEAESARATAQANLSLAEQKLEELQVEQLLASARAKKARLDAPGAIADFQAAAKAAQARGSSLDVAAEISDTLRYVATQLVQEGEKILCAAQNGAGPQCDLLVTGIGADGTGASAVIGLQYLAWARETAPEMRGWEMYQDTDQGTGTIRQQAAITASALFSQALALNPPASTAVYVWIAPGRFEMGSAAGECVAPGFGECPQNEQPRHRVVLDGYWIQRTAVTNEQYGRCVQAGVCKPPANSYWQVPSSARLPVTDVSWAKASQYAALVGGRLPTEAEWEYGCRGPDGRMYPWGDEPAEAPRLNYYNEYGRTIDVGSYAPGANGLYDMAGNVWEWTADWYDAAYYKESPERNPTGPAAETGLRPLRGGSWRNDGNLVRCAYRDDDDPANKYYNVGLRVVAPGF